jgi:chromosome segregation ATPase
MAELNEERKELQQKTNAYNVELQTFNDYYREYRNYLTVQKQALDHQKNSIDECQVYLQQIQANKAALAVANTKIKENLKSRKNDKVRFHQEIFQIAQKVQSLKQTIEQSRPK